MKKRTKSTKTSFSLTPVVRVEVRGDMVSALLVWAFENKIFAVPGSSMTSANYCIAYFTVENAEKIGVWLENHGAVNS